MTTEQSLYATGTKPEKKGGCFKGCLITAIICFVLMAGSMATVFFVGRSFINRKLPVWRDQYPALGTIMDLFDMSEELESLAEEMLIIFQRQSGKGDKTLVPDDISLYPEPMVETYSIISESKGAAFQRIDKSVPEAADYLIDCMAEKDWKLVFKQDSPEGYSLVWHKSQRTCQMEIMAYEQGHSEIWIRYSAFEKVDVLNDH